MIYNNFVSPIGMITVSSDGKGITSLHIEEDRYFTAIPDNWIKDAKDPMLLQAIAELKEYFAKKRTAFTVPISVVGTPFQQSVWKALQEIPSGSTFTYMQIADKIGKPKAIRAVGSAIGRNPVCIMIPCHRVIGSDGSFHGYVAGIERKKMLLALEGH